MCDELKVLLKHNPDGSMTSKLYRNIYSKQEDSRKPLLFNQNPFDYGKIWLKPLRRQPEPSCATPTARRGAPVYIDLRLQMHSMPDQLDLSALARAMQHLPHVRQLTFDHLHAPEEELKERIRGLKRL